VKALKTKVVPAVKELASDKKVRSHLFDAAASSRKAVIRANGNGGLKSSLTDRKVQKEMKNTLHSAQKAQKSWRRRKRRQLVKKKALIGTGIAALAAVVFFRSKSR